MDSERDVFRVVHDSIQGGGAGVVFGRNIWQHEQPALMIQAISQLINEKITIDQVLELLK